MVARGHAQHHLHMAASGGGVTKPLSMTTVWLFSHTSAAEAGHESLGAGPFVFHVALAVKSASLLPGFPP